ncbi:MAG: hypothetical protein IT205_01585 [Fimbriimonadaceae bacterium]|nr:hypothetical protein [Fimbriimonadaceae bacterium]
MLRTSLTTLIGLASAASMAATLTIQSPSPNDFLGKNSTLRFLITNATVQHRVQIRVTNIANPLISFTFQNIFNPDSDQRINGTINLSFNQSTPEGLYNAVVQVTVPSGTIPDQPINNLTVDVNDPKFLDSNPVTGSFVRGIVPIFLEIQEGNVDLWKVQVNGQDIPNNSDSTNTVNVPWDTTAIQTDGPQSISINVKDKALNEANKSINVTLDRVTPAIQVISPTGSTVRPNSTIPVVIRINDQFNGSVSTNAIQVMARRMDGTLIQRVTRMMASNTGTTLVWTGRIRKTAVLPSQFKLVVTAVDRAGNPAVSQEVVINRL